MAQWLRALAALAEDPSSTPSTHTNWCTPVIRSVLEWFQCLLLASTPMCMCTQHI